MAMKHPPNTGQGLDESVIDWNKLYTKGPMQTHKSPSE